MQRAVSTPCEGEETRGRRAPRRHLLTASQVLLSVLVLAWLLVKAEPAELAAAMVETSPLALVVAMGVQALALLVHEIRLWCALLPWRRVALGPVLGIGFLSGLLNFLLPARAGDMAAVGLLVKEQRVPFSSATVAVGVVALLEMLVFAALLASLMMAGALRLDLALGLEDSQRALGVVALMAISLVAASGVAVLVSRRLSRRTAPKGGRLVALLISALAHARAALGRPGTLSVNLGLAILQVALALGVFWILMPAGRLPPWEALLAATGVLAVFSLSAIVLPPGLLAGNAAASVLVLSLWGVDEAEALAAGLLCWFALHAPVVALGLPPLWRRMSLVGSILARRGAP